MTASTKVKAVMVMVSGHSQKILVLVEYTVTLDLDFNNVFWSDSLNPCFSGIYRDFTEKTTIKSNVMGKGLNPCFSGIYRDAGRLDFPEVQEKRLNPCFSGIYRDNKEEKLFESKIESS